MTAANLLEPDCWSWKCVGDDCLPAFLAAVSSNTNSRGILALGWRAADSITAAYVGATAVAGSLSSKKASGGRNRWKKEQNKNTGTKFLKKATATLSKKTFVGCSY
jgi:hypothetical protein